MKDFYKGMACVDCDTKFQGGELGKHGWNLVRVKEFEYGILCGSCSECRMMTYGSISLFLGGVYSSPEDLIESQLTGKRPIDSLEQRLDGVQSLRAIQKLAQSKR